MPTKNLTTDLQTLLAQLNTALGEVHVAQDEATIISDAYDDQALRDIVTQVNTARLALASAIALTDITAELGETVARETAAAKVLRFYANPDTEGYIPFLDDVEEGARNDLTNQGLLHRIFSPNSTPHYTFSITDAGREAAARR